MPVGVIAADLETFRASQYRLQGQDEVYESMCTWKTPSATICNYCGVWQPIGAAAINSPSVGGNPGGWAPPGPRNAGSVTESACGENEASESVCSICDDEPHSATQAIYDTTPAMPTVGYLTVANCGVLVACSYRHASVIQPLLAQVVELNGGCAVYS
jgi:hypothetical protein